MSPECVPTGGGFRLCPDLSKYLINYIAGMPNIAGMAVSFDVIWTSSTNNGSYAVSILCWSLRNCNNWLSVVTEV